MNGMGQKPSSLMSLGLYMTGEAVGEREALPLITVSFPYFSWTSSLQHGEHLINSDFYFASLPFIFGADIHLATAQ